MLISILDKANLKDISSELLMENGYIKLLSAKEYEKYPWSDFRLFCHENARYGIPTVELVSFIKELIGDRSAIEIGSGAGDLGFHLRIKMTDSKQQENPLVIQAYQNMGQPIIKYPKEVEKIDALQAVIKYKPQVVVASWITTYAPREMPYGSNPFGIREEEILNLVETFIIVGNLDSHGDKPILNLPHLKISEPWIISRGKNSENNIIFVFGKK